MEFDEDWANLELSSGEILQSIRFALYPERPSRMLCGRTLSLTSESFNLRDSLCYISNSVESRNLQRSRSPLIQLPMPLAGALHPLERKYEPSLGEFPHILG